jgi:hypothetical protein
MIEEKTRVPNDVHALTAMRARHGADSAIGHRCSNLMVLIKVHSLVPDGDARARLECNIRRQTTELAQLTNG